MTQQTVCPACGAPLEYEGEKEVVHCGFCSTDIAVIQEDDQVRFEVVAQPEPQKEVLSHVVEPQGLASEESEVVLEEQTVSDFPTFFTPAPSSQPVSSPSAFDPAPGAQVYQPVGPPAGKSSRNWLLISLGVVLGLCVLCACLAVAGVVFYNITGPVIW